MATTRTADAIQEMRAEISQELRDLRASVEQLRQQIAALEVHSARQNGKAENTNFRLEALEKQISSLPCAEHGEILAELRRSDRYHQRGWGYVIQAVLQIVLLVIGGIIGYFLR